MNRVKFAVVAAIAAATLMSTTGAHALFGSDACRRVTLAVNNDFGRAIQVQRFRMHSASEGRWLNEDFRNVDVPAGAQHFVVRRNETIEYGENDRIDQIEVIFRWRNREGRWIDERRVDRDIANQKCVADRTYVATVR